MYNEPPLKRWVWHRNRIVGRFAEPFIYSYLSLLQPCLYFAMHLQPMRDKPAQ
jgi:hypothetical protein